MEEGFVAEEEVIGSMEEGVVEAWKNWLCRVRWEYGRGRKRCGREGEELENNKKGMWQRKKGILKR